MYFGDLLVIVFDCEDIFYFFVFVYYFLECYFELMGLVWFFFEVVDKLEYLVLVVDCYVNFGLRVCLEFVSLYGWDKSKKKDNEGIRFDCLLYFLKELFVILSVIRNFVLWWNCDKIVIDKMECGIVVYIFCCGEI